MYVHIWLDILLPVLPVYDSQCSLLHSGVLSHWHQDRVNQKGCSVLVDFTLETLKKPGGKNIRSAIWVKRWLLWTMTITHWLNWGACSMTRYLMLNRQAEEIHSFSIQLFNPKRMWINHTVILSLPLPASITPLQRVIDGLIHVSFISMCPSISLGA